MIPVLYDHSETAFTSNGIGRLVDCSRCIVTEERNGTYECEFDYQVTGRHYSDIQIDRIVYVTHDDTKDPQPFDIYRRSAPINGIVTFYAHHISYRLGNILLDPFTATSCATALASFNLYSMVEHPFTFQTDKTVDGLFTVTVPISIKQMLGGIQGSILDVYGTGEYEFDKFDVNLWLHRGSDKGVRIVYSDSMSNLTHDLDYSISYNTVAPYWASMDRTQIVTLPERFVFSNNAPTVLNTWTDDDSPITDSSGQTIDFVTSDGKAVPLDLSDQWEEEPTENELREKALSYLNTSKAWVPSENLKVDFVALWQTEDYANVAPLQTVNLCDTVSVQYPELGVDAKVKVIKSTYNVLLDRYDEIELGDAKSSFADVITAKASAEVKENPAFLSSIAGEITRATDKITGMRGGNVVIDYNSAGQPYQILIMDTTDKETAVNVMRINNAGIGFSANGYSGPFTSAWTLDGHFVANFITAGTLSADLIRTGIVRSQVGNNYWNLDTGEFYTETDDHAVNIKNGRIYFYDPDNNDFFGVLSTYFIDANPSNPAIGMFTTHERIVFGRVMPNGTYGRGPSIFVGTVNPDDYYVYNKAGISAASMWSDIYYGTSTMIEGTANIHTLKVGANINRHDGTTAEGIYTFRYDGYLYAKRINLSEDSDFNVSNGCLRCVSVTQTSDRRLKNIQDWNDGYLKVFDAIEPVIYQWINDDTRTYVGYVAQDVKKALEDNDLDPAGIVDGSEDSMSLNYTSLFTVTAAKVKQQQKEIDDLKRRIERLERLIDEDK